MASDEAFPALSPWSRPLLPCYSVSVSLPAFIKRLTSHAGTQGVEVQVQLGFCWDALIPVEVLGKGQGERKSEIVSVNRKRFLSSPHNLVADKDAHGESW